MHMHSISQLVPPECSSCRPSIARSAMTESSGAMGRGANTSTVSATSLSADTGPLVKDAGKHFTRRRIASHNNE